MLDFTGFHGFLRISDLLNQGIEPKAHEWEEFFSAPGYRALLVSEFTREFFVSRMRLAFLAAAQKQGKQTGTDRFAEHYRRVYSLREELNEHAEKLASSRVAAEAMEHTLAWLPTSLRIKAGDHPPVAFLVFDLDARGYSPIVMDILASREWGDLSRFLGHEFHHYYRNKLLSIDLAIASAEDQPLLWVLNQLHCEGLADQIDKHEDVPADSLMAGFMRHYRKCAAEAPASVELLDRTLRACSTTPEQKRELGEALRGKLPLSGHPTGFYMANVILKQLGREPLIDTFASPFQFLELYTQAAKKDPTAPVLSTAALQYAGALTEKYTC